MNGTMTPLAPLFHEKPNRGLDEDWFVLQAQTDRPLQGFGRLYWHGPTAGTVQFWQDGVRVLISRESSPARVAGVIVETDEDLQILQSELESCTEGLTVWASPGYLERIAGWAAVRPIESVGVLFEYWVIDAQRLTGFRGLRSLSFPPPVVVDLTPFSTLVTLRALLLDCTRVDDLSPLAEMSRLTSLDLRTERLSDLRPLQRLRGLQSLHLDRSPPKEEIDQLLEHLPGLENLSLVFADKLEELPAIQHCPELRSLCIARCAVRDLSPIRTASKLEFLEIGSGKLHDLSPLSGHTSLAWLDLSGSEHIKDYAPLRNVPHLISLRLGKINVRRLDQVVRACPNLEAVTISSRDTKDVSALARLEHLQSLWFNSHVKNLQWLAGMRSLKQLDVFTRPAVPDYTPLGSLVNLEILRLQGAVPDFSWAGSLRNVTWLKAEGLSSDIHPLTKLPSLAVIDLEASPRLGDASPLGAIPSLVSVNLTSCGIPRLWNGTENRRLSRISLESSAISDLSLASTFPTLRELNLKGCAQISDFSPLGQSQSLVFLSLSMCPSAQGVSALAGAKRLRTLIAPAYETLTDLSCFESLTQLAELDISDMQQVVDLSPLKNLENLRRLWLYGCQKVRDLTPLIDLKRLEVLDLDYCPEIEDLSPLAEMPQLRILMLPMLLTPDLSFLEGLPNLIGLRMRYATMLSDLSPLCPILARGGDVEVPDGIKPALEKLKRECR